MDGAIILSPVGDEQFPKLPRHDILFEIDDEFLLVAPESFFHLASGFGRIGRAEVGSQDFWPRIRTGPLASGVAMSCMASTSAMFPSRLNAMKSRDARQNESIRRLPPA